MLAVGWARGHAVRFEKPGMDGSGEATLIAADGDAPGVLYAMDHGDLPSLDRFEGTRRGYDRTEGCPIFPDGRDLRVVTFLANHPRPGLSVFDWYLALVLSGAKQHGLASDYRASLRGTPWHPEPDRPRRLAALLALVAQGHAKPALLLQPLLNGVQSASASISSPIASRS